jgi:hypothetical protein
MQQYLRDCPFLARGGVVELADENACGGAPELLEGGGEHREGHGWVPSGKAREEGADVSGEAGGVGMRRIVAGHAGQDVPGDDVGVVTLGEAAIDLKSPPAAAANAIGTVVGPAGRGA